MTKTPGKLFLLPNLLGRVEDPKDFLPHSIEEAMKELDGLIAESEREGRRYLSYFSLKKPAQQIPIAVYNKNTPEDHIDFFLEPATKGENWGLVSDAGLPCIADPGADIVARARSLGISIEAFVGPSSIFLALMLSGLGGQRFTFHGYLNRNADNLQYQIEKIALAAKRDRTTQIFMEAPHRNRALLENLISLLPSHLKLCVAWDLTLPSQGVMTLPINSWQKIPLPAIEKKPALFLVG